MTHKPPAALTTPTTDNEIFTPFDESLFGLSVADQHLRIHDEMRRRNEERHRIIFGGTPIAGVLANRPAIPLLDPKTLDLIEPAPRLIEEGVDVVSPKIMIRLERGGKMVPGSKLYAPESAQTTQSYFEATIIGLGVGVDPWFEINGRYLLLPLGIDGTLRGSTQTLFTQAIHFQARVWRVFLDKATATPTTNDSAS